ncbi:unnamed protein product [Chrysodeixis includens]|uniref:Cleavage and polyadenylation specificity factor subunit 2 n=1 Tax=Chrysodeixis includens TaxID=689277 RepID=A0A9P0BTY5_CHRIL|nr:unnamed protein product [Chrysodeixis includens]
MTSIIKLHCLSGAGDETPPCYVLQIDEFKFLLDCGWDEKFDMEFIKELKRHINTIDAVLISHSDPVHLGALPYAVGKLGLNCPIYATLPVYKMGQMFMYDLYQAHKNVAEFDLFTLDDVDAAFDRIVQLKYNQSIDMKGKGLGLRITPLPAGHSLGGTVWRIAAPGEEDIVYAPDFNHKKERHLNGCEIERLMRPSLMLLGAMNADYVQQRRRLRDEKLMTTILTTLRGGGCVLVCTDTAGRVLELAHMLDQLWRNKDSGLVAYSLLLLSNVSYNVVEFAKSQIEWMSDKLTRAFEGARSNPFALRHLQLCHSVGEVSRTPGPKVVLASFPDLESGFARDLFLLWAPNPQNSIVLTARTSPGTLARDLIEKGGERTIELNVRRRVRLEGAELEEFMQNQRVKVNNTVNSIHPREETAGISSDSDSDGELEMWVVTGKHDIPVRHDVRATGCFKSNKRHHAMYPFHEERTRADDYGEMIKPEDYRLAEIVDAEGEIRDVPPAPVPKQEPEEEMTEIPSKCISSMRQVQIKANIQYIELEGRCDGESLLRVVTQAKPRAIVGLRAHRGALQTLKKHCEAEGIEKIYIPQAGEVIDATTESHIYQVKLTDSLMSGLAWRAAGDAELAWLSAQLVPRASQRENATAIEEATSDVSMSLEAAPAVSGHAASFVNAVRLSELRAALHRLGLNTEFTGGALECCNGTLAIRRLENGRVALEGVLSEEYYKVRELLYEQFAIV